jgi:hypothetical protein
MIGRGSPAFAFWLDYLDSRGGLWEHSDDAILTVLPDQLRATHDLPESGLVTDDPDISREDGVLFLGTGHPEISKAAEAVIDAGDVGVLTVAHLVRAPSTEELLARIREQIPVDHGRIDATGAPIRTHRATLRLGALVRHSVSADEQFTEVIECLVDVPTRIPWPELAAGRLRDATATTEAAPGRAVQLNPLVPALTAAHRALDAEAVRRGQALEAEAATEQDTEITRAGEYYAAALAAIDKRRAGADQQRLTSLAARAGATIAERDRRLAEISEKYRHRYELRPYRLHLIDVPVWRLTTDVRRGDRRWPLTFDYLPTLGAVAPTRCPTCAAHASLVATKTHLGCSACVATKPASEPPQAPPSPAPPGPKPTGSPAPDSRETRRAVAATGEQRPGPTASATSRKRHSAPAVEPTVPSAPLGDKAVRLVLPGKAEERKVVDFWNHLSVGESRKLARLIAPDSPLAALTRLYRAAGPLYGIGVPGGDTPEKFTCGNYDIPVAGQRAGTAGALHTRHGEFPFLLLWSPDRLLEEIFPYSAPWHLGAASRMGLAPVIKAPPTLVDIDVVARLLFHRTTARHGLTFAARALAAWWRLPDPDDLLALFAPEVVAAAVDRAVRYWSGAAQSGYPAAAEAFHAEEAAVRKATPVLQKLLGLNDTRNW